MKQVLLGLGSNKSFNGSSSIELLTEACRKLKSFLKNPVFSSVYKTRAMYVTNQEDFYNMVCSGFVTDETDPFELLKKINAIEAEYGRDRSKEIRFGPRSLDIDIELFGNDRINAANLIVPHIRLQERAFVLIPALEILTESAENKSGPLFENNWFTKETVESWINKLPEEDLNLKMVFPAKDFTASL